MYKSSGRIKNSTLLLRTIELRRLNRHLAKLKIKDVRREHVQNAVNRLSEKLAKASMLGTLAVCRMVFTKAYEMDLIKRNPTEFVEIPTKVLTLEEYENQFTLPKFLEKDELVQFLDIVKDCGDELDYPIFLTLAYTGMRSGELCGLMWKDIDFERNEISINRTMFTPTNTPPGYELQTPKTRRSKRTISVAPNVINELRKLQKVQREFVMRYRNEFQDLGFVFANLHFHRGLPTIQLRIKHQFQMFLGIIKIKEHLTPHSLRHTHASLLAQAGVSLEAIMERLGHSNDRVTREIYLHITEHTKKEASDKFAKLLDSI
jgi:integrase